MLLDYIQKVPADRGRRGRAHHRRRRGAQGPRPLRARARRRHLGRRQGGARRRATGCARHDLRGSSALAFEADVVLIVNDKVDVVSREHLVYNLGNIQRFRGWSVVSVEKNRHGKAHVELEFAKDFEHGRFHTEGQEVTERLIDDRVFVS